MATGRYGMAIIGFACNHETKDDAGQFDGKRDEVYFFHQVRRVSGIDGRIISSEGSRTGRIMGDTNGYPNRVRVGTGDGVNGLGGIRSGDSYPKPLPVNFADGSSANADYPPYKIGEYELTEGTGDTYFITVSLWEWDEGQSVVTAMVNWLSTIDGTYGEKAKDLYTKVYPPNEIIFSAVSLGIQTLKTTADLMGNRQSRPIGLLPDNNQVTGNARWGSDNPVVIALSYETAEYLSQQDSIGLGRGVISRTLIDAPELEGNYDIYLKCYKISGTDDDSSSELSAKTKTFAIDASNPNFVSDGGATISGFIATSSNSEDILATVTGWRPGAGGHPTSMLVKRANQGGKDGIWFRLNFVNDVANGITWICFYQGGNPSFTSGPEPTTVTFDGQPWH